ASCAARPWATGSSGRCRLKRAEEKNPHAQASHPRDRRETPNERDRSKKIAHEHKDRQLMDRVAKAARHLVKWIHNEGLIKGEDVHLKTLEEAIRKLDKHRGAGTAGD